MHVVIVDRTDATANYSSYLHRDSTLAINKNMYMHLLAEDVLARYIALVCVCYSMLCVLK